MISSLVVFFDRKTCKARNATCVGKGHSTWTQRIPRVVPAAFVLESVITVTAHIRGGLRYAGHQRPSVFL